jgi:hypothetical protein
MKTIYFTFTYYIAAITSIINQNHHRHLMAINDKFMADAII